MLQPTLGFLLLLFTYSQCLYYQRVNTKQEAFKAEVEFFSPTLISCSLKCYQKNVQYDPASGRCLCFTSSDRSYAQIYLSFVPLEIPCDCKMKTSCTYVSNTEYKCDCGKLYGGDFCEKNVTNVALKKPTNQTSTFYSAVASRAVDGDTGEGIYSSNHCSHSGGNAINCWMVNFQQQVVIVSIVIYNRIDCCSDRLNDASIAISEGSGWKFCGSVGNMTNVFKKEIECVSQKPVAQFLKICNTNQPLSLCEVIVNGYMPW